FYRYKLTASHPAIEPGLQSPMSQLRQLRESHPGSSLRIRPNHFSIDLECHRIRQHELQAKSLGEPDLLQCPNRQATHADIGGFGFQLSVHAGKVNRHFESASKVAAVFAYQETGRSNQRAPSLLR